MSITSISYELSTSPGARPCAFCKLNVLASRHALQCALCTRWQHRVCHRGNMSRVSYEDYIDLLENRNLFTWHCVNCPQPGPQTHDGDNQVDSMVSGYDNTTSSDTLVDSENTIIFCNETVCADVLYFHENTTSSDNQAECDNTLVLISDGKCADKSAGDASIDMLALLQEHGDALCLAPSIDETHGTVLSVSSTENNTTSYLQTDKSKDCSLIKNFVNEFEIAEGEDNKLTLEQQPSLCTPFPMHTHDVENTITLDYSDIRTQHDDETASTLDQEEVPTVLFHSEESPVCLVSPAVGVSSLDYTADKNNISMSSVSFCKQSTPIAPSRAYRRLARSFLRRISAISANTSIPGRELSFTSVDLTPISFSTRSKTHKRQLLTEDGYPASKKRIMESSSNV